MSNSRIYLAVAALACSVACAEQGKLKVEGKIAESSAALAAPGQSLELGEGQLLIDDARVRVTEIEFEGGEDEEREAEFGAAEIPLALDGGPTTVAADSVEAGSYHTLGLELRSGNSIVINGSYDGQPFSFVSGLAPELEFPLRPEVVVPADGEATVGVTFDIAAWFALSDGTLLNPGDPANVSTIESNIMASMAAHAEIELSDGD